MTPAHGRSRHDVQPVCGVCGLVSWWGWCDYCEAHATIRCNVCDTEVIQCSYAKRLASLPPDDMTALDIRVAGGLRLASPSVDCSVESNGLALSFLRCVWSDTNDALAPLVSLSLNGSDVETRLVREAAAHVLGLRSAAVLNNLSRGALDRAAGAKVDRNILSERRWPAVLASALTFRSRPSTMRLLGPLEIELFTFVLDRTRDESFSTQDRADIQPSVNT
jgi:hypothetical protein